MDQIKIGHFIAECRKERGWTQSLLAEKLGITDKAVSKWENGRSMPDLSLFKPLCELFEITLNELLSGERISEEELKEKSNQLLFDVIQGWLGGETAAREETLCENPVLRLNNITKHYGTGQGETAAVNKVSFELTKGSFVGIMGASGCGKTTLLNLIATIDRAEEGTIEIDGVMIGSLSGKELADFRKIHLGFIFQDYNLLETLTLYENIALAMTMKQMNKTEIDEKIRELAQKLEIEEVLDQFPHAVSGGQRQRCACARAIAKNPSLILADEPTGALDSYSAKQLLRQLLAIRQEYHATILMVTHDAFSASYCDTILFMRDGEIVKELKRGTQSVQDFFTRILDQMSEIQTGRGSREVCDVL